MSRESPERCSRMWKLISHSWRRTFLWLISGGCDTRDSGRAARFCNEVAISQLVANSPPAGTLNHCQAKLKLRFRLEDIFLWFRATLFVAIAQKLFRFPDTDFDASREGGKAQGKRPCSDIHLSVKSDCTLEMPSLQISQLRDEKNHKIGNLLVCKVGMIGKYGRNWCVPGTPTRSCTKNRSDCFWCCHYRN